MAKVKVTTDNGIVIKTFEAKDYFIATSEISKTEFIQDLLEALAEAEYIERYPNVSKELKSKYE